jgi:hypothetical protein
MKSIFILLLVLVAGRVAAQTQPTGQQSLAANVNIAKQFDKRATDYNAFGADHRAVFTYRGNFATHHDTVTYLRDTMVYKRPFCLVQLASGEIRRVPAGSIKPLNNNQQQRAGEAYYSNNR